MNELIHDPYDRAVANRAAGPGPAEPSDLDLAIIDRLSMHHPAIGPLTAEQAEELAAYDRYMAEELAELAAFEAAGGRSLCPSCGKRTVRHGSACTLGYPGHPGAEFSATYECEAANCDYKEMA